MRLALIPVVLILMLSGCSGERDQPLPTAPDPPVSTAPPPLPPPLPPARPSDVTFVWVVVIEKGQGGMCIPGATVEIVRGQGVGRHVTQTTGFCSYWDPDFDAVFNELNLAEELTLRASATGYAAQEITVTPTWGWQTAVTFELSKIQ